MIHKNNPIGIFDSGVGGTSVLKDIISLMPYENTIYLADSKNAPYGQKSEEEIIALSEKNTALLLEKGAKIIVVACNTATTNAINHLRQKYKLPFVGIEPAIKPAALNTKHRAVGVLATQGTLSSKLFDETKGKFARDIKVVEQVGEGLVPLVEQNLMESSKAIELLKKYLQPMIEAHIDYLILGCTHYPYLIPQIKKLLPNYVQIIDSGKAVARQTKNLLQQNNLLTTSNQPGKHSLFSNADSELLKTLVKDVEVPMDIKYLDF